MSSDTAAAVDQQTPETTSDTTIGEAETTNPSTSQADRPHHHLRFRVDDQVFLFHSHQQVGSAEGRMAP